MTIFTSTSKIMSNYIEKIISDVKSRMIEEINIQATRYAEQVKQDFILNAMKQINNFRVTFNEVMDKETNRVNFQVTLNIEDRSK